MHQSFLPSPRNKVAVFSNILAVIWNFHNRRSNCEKKSQTLFKKILHGRKQNQVKVNVRYSFHLNGLYIRLSFKNNKKEPYVAYIALKTVAHESSAG